MSMMIFIFLCFSGLFVMFFFILRGQEKIHTTVQEEMAQLRAQVRQMESRITGVPQESAPSPVQQHIPAQPAPAFDRLDPLDSLSMDSSSTPPSGGLDLHFDPQQDFRR